MKKTISVLLACVVIVLSCAPSCGYAEGNTFRGMGDVSLREYISDALYDSLLDGIDSDMYAVAGVQTVYISQEYIDELAFNSQSNVYFGYSLEELDAQFQGTRYIFTLGDDNQTVVREFKDYDDTYDRVIRNVAAGTGVILVCVTVSAVSAGAGAPAVSMIFAVAAKTGTTCALSGSFLGGISSAIITGIETGDMEEVKKAAALGASEGFKWGAITGAASGALREGVGLYQATLAPNSQLTMNDVAIIQKESKLPLSFIKYMHSMDEYNLYRQYGLEAIKINGTMAYGQTIDLTLTDSFGRTNVERITKGLAPVDAKGVPYELHHIGQAQDSPLAILTQEQHRGTGNFGKLHFNTGDTVSSVDHGEIWQATKDQFWNDYLKMFGG